MSRYPGSAGSAGVFPRATARHDQPTTGPVHAPACAHPAPSARPGGLVRPYSCRMTKRGDLYDLIDRAPVGLTSFGASLWKWTHRERAARAREQLSEGRAVLHFGSTAGRLSETSNEHLRVWLAPPGQW